MFKIIKIDENNQCGNAMAKPLPTGCIKRCKKIPTEREFDLIVQSISNEDKVGHLFTVDFEFGSQNFFF